MVNFCLSLFFLVEYILFLSFLEDLIILLSRIGDEIKHIMSCEFAYLVLVIFS